MVKAYPSSPFISLHLFCQFLPFWGYCWLVIRLIRNIANCEKYRHLVSFIGLRRLNGIFLIYRLFTDFHGYKIASWTYDSPSLSLNRRPFLVLIDDQFKLNRRLHLSLRWRAMKGDEGCFFSYSVYKRLYIRYLCLQYEGWRVFIVSLFKFSMILSSNPLFHRSRTWGFF